LRGNVLVKEVAPADGGANGEAGIDANFGSSPIENTRPGAGSLVFVELCDLYGENPDPSKGHPNYRYVALADDSGNFDVDIPKGTIGLHTLLEGFLYGSKLIPDSTASGIEVTAEGLAGRAKPQASDFIVTPSEAQQGTTLTFSLRVQSAPNDPISEEVLLAEPVSGLARAFDPPSRGHPGKGFPDGIWTVSLGAPPPGKYAYYAQAVSEGCAVSTRLSVLVTVR
jgi:hypothetical protein